MKYTLLQIFTIFACFSFCFTAKAQDTIRVQSNVDTNLLIVDSLKNDTITVNDSLSKIIQNDSLKTNDTLLTATDSSSKKKVKEPFERQLRVMVDVFQPISNIISPGKYTYELALDYNISKDAFLVFEAGNGGGKVDYDNLKYKSNNTFFKFGIEKSFFDPMYTGDWDMIVMGARYGIGFGQRGDATFTIPNPFGGIAAGETPAKNFVAHWGEVLMGLRFEILPRVYMGWNVRMRFNFTPGIFDGQVAPKHLAGYGQADKANAFGFNYYIGYAIRWNKKNATPPPTP